MKGRMHCCGVRIGHVNAASLACNAAQRDSKGSHYGGKCGLIGNAQTSFVNKVLLEYLGGLGLASAEESEHT